MSIPIATTTVTVRRLPVDETRDGYDTPPGRTDAATGLRAVIGSPSGDESIATGDRTVTTFTLNTDPFAFQPTDQVLDETTGALYELDWAEQRTGLIPHSTGQIRRVSGAA